MASVYDLKPRFQALLRPMVERLANAGVTANQVTLAALALSVLTGAVLAVTAGMRGFLLLMPLTLFARMALNAIDGMLAREHDQKSVLGAILNEIGDVLSDLALYLALVPALGVFGVAAAPIVFFALGASLTEFAGILGQTIGGGRRYDGPMGKSDRAAAIGLACFLVALFGVPVLLLDAVFVTLAIAAALTVWTRLAAALKASGGGSNVV